MKTKLILFVSLFFLIYLVSCTSNSIENEDIQTQNSIVDEALRFYAQQTLDNSTILTEEPNWGNAVVSKTTDGSPLVTVQVYKGENNKGLDSIQEIQFVQRKSGNIMLLRTLSSFNKDIAKVEFFTLKGRLLEDGMLYIPKNRYSTIKVYYRIGSNNKTIRRAGAEDGCSPSIVEGSGTPIFNPDGSYNTNAYNCHQYVWGDPSPNDPNYYPFLPHWRDYAPDPTKLGYSVTSTPSVGDRIIIYGTDILGNYSGIHSAIVTCIDGGTVMVTGKDSDGPIKITEINNTGYSGNIVIYHHN